MLYNIPFYCISYFIHHSSSNGHLGCFYLLAIANIAALNTGKQLSIEFLLSVFGGYILRSGIAESYGNSMGFPSSSAVRICLEYRSCSFDPWVGKIPWRRAWQPTTIFLHGEAHGQRSLVGCIP